MLFSCLWHLMRSLLHIYGDIERNTHICVFLNDNQDFIEKASQLKKHILRGYKK